MANGNSTLVQQDCRRVSIATFGRKGPVSAFSPPADEVDASNATPAHPQVDWNDTKPEKKPGKKTRKLVAIRCPECEIAGVDSKRYRCASHIAYKINWGSFSGRCAKHQGRSGHWAKELKSPPHVEAAA